MLGDISPGKLVFSRPPLGEGGGGSRSWSWSHFRLRQGRWSHSARGANAAL